MDWRFILSLLFAVIVAVFAVQNAGTIEVNFFTFNIAISQALVILISAIFGAIAVMLFSLVRWIKFKSKVKNLTKTITLMEEENRILEQKLKTNRVTPANKVIPIHQAEKNLDKI